ncbi:hypothetical protein [Chengkuizengella sediminis]|uniref:hypothetical protein n=1 Tax=Chengkuizengella sediminis TaxID=1885917 RepID=UPI00138A4B07|nr:hypothetical protein [Chengkuizengella sediminis]NDI34561.1 hypothetical protein [Chengkuizengella sediminis]
MKKIFICVMTIVLLSTHISTISLACENQSPEPKQGVRALQSDESTTKSSMPMLILKEDGTVEFREAWHLSDDSLADALYIADKLTQAVNRETLELEFCPAISIIREDATMGLLGTFNSTIYQEDANVEFMSSQLVDLFTNRLRVELTEDQLAAYEETMRATFLNLVPYNTGWLQWKETNESSISYLYNLLFAVERDGRLLGMPVGVTIGVNCSMEEYLNEASFTNYNYSVNVKAIKIMKL